MQNSYLNCTGNLRRVKYNDLLQDCDDPIRMESSDQTPSTGTDSGSEQNDQKSMVVASNGWNKKNKQLCGTWMMQVWLLLLLDLTNIRLLEWKRVTMSC